MKKTHPTTTRFKVPLRVFVLFVTFVISLGLLAQIFYVKASPYYVNLSWPVTDGYVVNFTTGNDRRCGKPDTKFYPRVNYFAQDSNVKHAEYSIQNNLGVCRDDNDSIKVGDSLRVAYNPDNPAEAKPAEYRSYQFWITGTFLFALAATLYLLSPDLTHIRQRFNRTGKAAKR